MLWNIKALYLVGLLYFQTTIIRKKGLIDNKLNLIDLLNWKPKDQLAEHIKYLNE